MNALFKSGAMLALVALILGMLGFYDNISQAVAQPQPVAEADKPVADTTGSLKADNQPQEQTLVDRVAMVDKVALSEKRIKTNITKLEPLTSGLNLYSYQYRTDPTVYVGLLATELAANERFSQFVVHMGEGHYTINYGAMKLHQITMDDYKRDGAKAVIEETNIALQNSKIPTN